MQNTTRRQFLRQTVAFSALASAGPAFHALAAAPCHDPHAQHLLMIGDWGAMDPTAGQDKVAAAMADYTKRLRLNPQSLLFLGDAWYGDLAGGAQCPRWQSQFEQMYPASVFPGPAYSILGNHDYQHLPLTVNKRDAELEYARTGKSRWTMPARWYTFDVLTRDKKPLLHVLAVDSNAPKNVAPADHVNFTLTDAEWAEQKSWLAAELAKPTAAPFTIVMGHHPIYSNGPHGDHATLIADWEPLLRQHHIPLYLAGHDHDLQHLEFAGHPTSFVCSGGGGADLYDLKIAETQRGPYAHKVFGFTHLEATPQALILRHVNARGEIIHAFRRDVSGDATIL